MKGQKLLIITKKGTTYLGQKRERVGIILYFSGVKNGIAQWAETKSEAKSLTKEELNWTLNSLTDNGQVNKGRYSVEGVPESVEYVVGYSRAGLWLISGHGKSKEDARRNLNHTILKRLKDDSLPSCDIEIQGLKACEHCIVFPGLQYQENYTVRNDCNHLKICGEVGDKLDPSGESAGLNFGPRPENG